MKLLFKFTNTRNSSSLRILKPALNIINKYILVLCYFSPKVFAFQTSYLKETQSQQLFLKAQEIFM